MTSVESTIGVIQVFPISESEQERALIKNGAFPSEADNASLTLVIFSYLLILMFRVMESVVLFF